MWIRYSWTKCDRFGSSCIGKKKPRLIRRKLFLVRFQLRFQIDSWKNSRSIGESAQPRISGIMNFYSRFEAKWALRVAIVENWMKKWSVNTDNTVTA